MRYIEFFRVYDSFGNKKSPVLYLKIIEEGKLDVASIKEEVIGDLKDEIEKVLKDEDFLNKYPFMRGVKVGSLVYDASNAIYSKIISSKGNNNV